MQGAPPPPPQSLRTRPHSKIYERFKSTLHLCSSILSSESLNIVYFYRYPSTTCGDAFIHVTHLSSDDQENLYTLYIV